MTFDVTSATTTLTTASSVAAEQVAVDFESFLILLTAQIQNQDPLSPMDSTDFVSQLAQLTQVEQSVQTNSNLEDIYAKLSASVALADVSLIGREVTFASEEIALSDGAAVIDFELAETSVRTQVFIYDEDGLLVRNLIGLSTDGLSRNTVAWDGLDESGELLADGQYTVDILAVDDDGNLISYNTYSTSVVQSVSFSGGVATFLLGTGEEVGSDDIVTVG